MHQFLDGTKNGGCLIHAVLVTGFRTGSELAFYITYITFFHSKHTGQISKLIPVVRCGWHSAAQGSRLP